LTILVARGLLPAFQSPSLRGSGRFVDRIGQSGAVERVSIPFIAGQWSLPALAVWRAHAEEEVSIPFIAGQWSLRAKDLESAVDEALFQSPSLRGSGRFALVTGRPVGLFSRFNPLHCGAVVASNRLRSGGGAVRFFNPLHCGAVVASAERRCAKLGADLFQSPSLRGSGRFRMPTRTPRSRQFSFQSPSLRGSGRFYRRARRSGPALKFSIPFIAGQWSLPPAARVGAGPRLPFSIPFIAGQWSLHADETLFSSPRRIFQSPSLRGSGRFDLKAASGADQDQIFQSPSLRGSGRFLTALRDATAQAHFSIPFIAGQWSLQQLSNT